ncbi:hypothetical protein [Aeromicrobium sp. HA]|uniref:hypothetical protein n=1 Tax=Aeromicrobium sp. HA TaxID=3009077 RepID=UPI0022AE71BC|nr:hypothetical protein [Aeromicrobium sp. HA]
MSDETPRVEPSFLPTRTEIDTAVWTGYVFASVALLTGVLMALKRKLVPCPDGTEFSENATSFDCYVHPNLGIGVSIASLSVTIAAIVFLVGVVARAAVRAWDTASGPERQGRGASEDEPQQTPSAEGEVQSESGGRRVAPVVEERGADL